MPMNARQMLAGLPVRRFAEGGDVTDAQIRDWLAANAGASDAQIAQAMDQYGVTPARLAAAAGYDPQEVTRRYEAARSTAESERERALREEVNRDVERGRLIAEQYGPQIPADPNVVISTMPITLPGNGEPQSLPTPSPTSSVPGGGQSSREMLAAVDAANVIPEWQAGQSAGRARAIANGNEAGWLAQVKASADAYMARADIGTAAEAYDAMIRSGIGIQDLLDSGVSQETINKALAVETAPEQKAVNTLTQRALTSTLAQNPTLASEMASRGSEAIYAQARQFVENLQKDGLTPEERRYMQQVASQQGWGYSDIRAAGIDPNILFDDTAAAEAERQRLAAEAAAEAERQRLAAEAAAEAERQRLAAEAAAEAERKRKAAEEAAAAAAAAAAAEAERQRKAAEAAEAERQRKAAEEAAAAAAAAEAERKRLADAQVVAPGVTTGDMVRAVTPTYSAQELRDVIAAAEQQPAALGTVTNPMDTRGTAETGSQSGVSEFLETYTAPTPFTPPEYTAPTVYSPETFARENAGADLYKKGEIALDTAFRESAPRTAIPGMPGSYEYTPAASLRPATGAGWSWTPPIVTSRPRSLLSPTLLSYVSPSQQFAQSRAAQDQALLRAFRESGLPQNASNFYSWRNRLRSGEFGAGAAFDPTAFQSAFGSWASTQTPVTTAQGAAPLGGVTGYSEIAGGIQPIDLRTLPTFADGGEATSARGMLERLKKPEGFADGGIAAAAPEQTESRSMLDRLASAASTANRAFYENVSGPAVGSLVDMTVGLGDLAQAGARYLGGRMGYDTGEYTPVAPRVRQALGVDNYDPYTVGGVAANILPFARGEQTISAVATGLPRVLPNLGRETGAYVGSELAAAGAQEIAPDSTAAQMLASVAGGMGGSSLGGLPSSAPAVRMTEGDEAAEAATDSSKMLAELDSVQTPADEISVRPEITSEIGDRRRVGTTGRYVGAPEGINTPQKLAALTRSITNLTKEGEFGRFWYERSGRQILDITGGNVEDADKLVQAIAITSPNTPVGANFDYALQAYYQWKNGQPIRTGMYTTAMSDKLQRMFDGEEWAGRKTNNFYNNLMREIDPSKAQGVTTDIWMMRAFGFDKEAPTPAQYSFVENETKRIAKNLGWEPQQVQAAIWVALKSRMENPDVKRAVEEKSFENGWITYNDEGERVVIDQNKHAANWLEKAMQHMPTDADREAAKFDYADAAANNLAQISWESIPSRTSGHMPEIFEAAPEVVQDYHVQMSKAFLDDDGNDIIAKEFDILSPGDFEAPGYFEQRVSPGTQTNITAPRQYGVTRRIEAIKKQAAEEGWSKEQRDAAIRAATYATDPSAREAMYAYAAVRGILLKQDGVGMHRPAFITGLSRPKANGIEVNIGRPLTARETAEIARLVAAEAGHTEYNPIGSPSGVRFINFDYLGTPNLDFQKVVNNALKQMNFDNDESFNAKMFGADTGYLGNNWKENFNGEGYLESGELARRPDLQRKVRDLVTRLAPRVSAVEEEFANRYNWNRNTALNRSYEAQQAVGAPTGTVTPAPEIPELPATVRSFKRGGSVERMINDNRKYF